MSVSYPEPSTKLTYDDYVLFPNDGMRHEIINGKHFMNAAPSPRHQLVSRRIQFQLYEQIELTGLGEVINAPIDLQLSETDIVQPDLLVILAANDIITETRIMGAPDLVVEVLSKSTSEYDRKLKKQLYEQAAVPEYWIVDAEKELVESLKLNRSGRYQVDQNIVFQPTSATVDLTKVW